MLLKCVFRQVGEGVSKAKLVSEAHHLASGAQLTLRLAHLAASSATFFFHVALCHTLCHAPSAQLCVKHNFFLSLSKRTPRVHFLMHMPRHALDTSFCARRGWHVRCSVVFPMNRPDFRTYFKTDFSHYHTLNLTNNL